MFRCLMASASNTFSCVGHLLRRAAQMPSYAPYADVQVTTIVHAYGTVSSVRSRQTFSARVALRSLHEREEGNKSHLMFMRCVAMKMAVY